MSISRGVVHVGTPPTNYSGWTTTEVQFHNFANLSTERDEDVSSPKFSSLGNPWRVDIYPGGRENSDEGYVAILLSNMSNKSIKIEYGYRVRDATSNEVHHAKVTDIRKFGACDTNGGYNGWACDNFAKRSKIMKLLVNGTLVVEVRMRLPDSSNSLPPFIPSNPICKHILNKFMDEESADVVFEVVGRESETSTTFYAHRFILQDFSTTLAELCKPSDGGESTPIAIADIEPGVFKHILYYMYGGEISDEELEANAKEIIDACDKYGVVSLKLEAEACYVKTTQFSVDNMIDNLLYADSKNLALLKEAMMDYIVANKNSIMGKVSFDNVPGTMITDVLAAMARVDQSEEEGDSESIKYNKMRVSELREMLDEKGLEVDGSREAMIAILKEQSPM